MDAKRISTCAALLASLLFLNGGLVAAVQSDIVGYTTMTMEAGKWYQVCIPFDTLDKEAVVTLAGALSSGFTEGDTALIFDEEVGTYTQTRVWSIPKDGSEPTWCTKRGAASDVALALGASVFIQKKSKSDVSLAGRVNEKAFIAFGKETGNSWAQIGLPVPEKIDVNDMKWEGLQEGDVLYVYDPTEQTYSISRIWSRGKTEADSVLKWRTKRGVASELIIDVGQSLFVNKISAGYATLSK